MIIAQAEDVESLQRLLQAVDQKSSTLAADLHPAWVDAAWARLGPQAAAWVARVPPRRHSALLAKAYGLIWPPLDVFREPAHRIALLERSELLKVLAACALDRRRDSVRRSVSRVVRNLMIEGIGESAYEKVLDSPVRGMRACDPLGAVEVGQDRLAADGFRALCSQAAWRNRSLITLVRLSLAPSTVGEPLQTDGSPSSTAIKGADRMTDRLHDYFPELAWLFGSNMDRALSASRTASYEAQTLQP
jgi:Bacterial type III secretion protein (HrpB4)